MMFDPYKVVGLYRITLYDSVDHVSWWKNDLPSPEELRSLLLPDELVVIVGVFPMGESNEWAIVMRSNGRMGWLINPFKQPIILKRLG